MATDAGYRHLKIDRRTGGGTQPDLL
jgi:hypothetical protein